jgi:hypothetical protein
MTAREFLEHQASALTDGVSIPCKNKCGQCHKARIGAKIALSMLNGPLPVDAIRVWERRTMAAWKISKYYKLYVVEMKAGRNPKKAFKERGWQL